jgi:hypothetical protein
MLTNRISKIVFVLVVAATALLTVSMAVSTRAAGQPFQDYAQRHPGVSGLPAAILSDYYQGSDYFQRHPELSQLVKAIDTSDYYLRHPEWQLAIQMLDTSDYYLRHPELSGH